MPEALEPERRERIVAEALRRGRRRRHRRLLVVRGAGMIAVVALVAAVGVRVTNDQDHDKQVQVLVPPSSSPQSTASISRPVVTLAPPARGSVDPQSFELVAPGHAWLVASDPLVAVFRTTNGGRDWSDVTPAFPGPDISHSAVTGFVATDDDHAIVAVPRAPNAASVTLYATSDGGRTWSPTTIPGYDTQRFSFISPLEGWDESSRGAAASNEAVDIWHTVDGGVHWEQMSRGDGLAGSAGTAGALESSCDKNGIGFVDASTGFATGSCATGFIYFAVTHDAGRTWENTSLPLPRGVTPADVQAQKYQQFLQAPVFDGLRGAGVVDGVTVTDHKYKHHNYLYVSSDGGATWSLADPPLRGVKWVETVTATQWWAGNDSSIVITTDSGAHWTRLHPNVRLLPGPVQSVAPSSAWTLQRDQAGAELWQTNDAGRTWASVTLPKTDRRSPTATTPATTS